MYKSPKYACFLTTILSFYTTVSDACVCLSFHPPEHTHPHTFCRHTQKWCSLLHRCLRRSCSAQSPIKVLWFDFLRCPCLTTRSQFHVILDDSHLSNIWNGVCGTIRVAELAICTTCGKASWSSWKSIFFSDGLTCWTSNSPTQADQGVQRVLHAMVDLSSTVHLLCHLSIE